jgi:AmmeMemoRadiSam system protein B
MSIRKHSVAGQFYPSDAKEINSIFEHYNKIIDENLKNDFLSIDTKAVIVPHAGYIYSGFTANIAYRLLKNSYYKRVVVIGPSHRIYLNGISVSDYDYFQTPLGDIKIDKELVSVLKDKFGVDFILQAHAEHSTEVQAPFIKNYMPNSKIVELVYGDEKPTNISKIIDYLLEDKETAIIISTDLSHFYKIKEAKDLDSICLDAILNLDTDKLHQGCEACGKIGVEAMLHSAKKYRLKPTLLDYRTSADVSGDESSVVGYVSVAFV